MCEYAGVSTQVITLDCQLHSFAQSTENGEKNIQGMVDGSASKPALRPDTSYMVKKT